MIEIMETDKTTADKIEIPRHELARLKQAEEAFLVWQAKTEWVQNTCEPGELGMHRADALRRRIERLQAPYGFALGDCQHQLGIAITHLHAILNLQRTATQSWEAEKAARDWLESIGSEPGEVRYEPTFDEGSLP